MSEPTAHIDLTVPKKCVFGRDCRYTATVHVVAQDVSLDSKEAYYAGWSVCLKHWEEVLRNGLRMDNTDT